MRNIAICTLIALSTLVGAGTAHAERVETSLTGSSLALVDAAKPKPETQLEGKININTADEKALELLPGVGPSTAHKIVAYRAKHKEFKDVLHLMRIKGIGRKTFNDMKPYLALEGETTLRKVK